MGSNGHNGAYPPELTPGGELIDYKLPWQSIPGEWSDEADVTHAARLEAVGLINAFAAQLESVFARRDCTLRDVKIKFYAIAGGLGLSVLDGKSFTDLSSELQCSRATLSKIATEFCSAQDLGASFMMKSEAARPAYQRGRLDAIRRANGHKLPDPPEKHRSV